MNQVAIVTDSTSDLDATDAQARGITVVPLFVNFGDTRFRDQLDLTREQFYELLAHDSALPTTTQPTPAMFEEAFRPLVRAGRPIVCVTITQSLSGTINAANTAAKAFPEAEIFVIDSGTVAGGLAIQAQHANDLARDGAEAATIVAALENDYATLRGFATVPDLSHAVRTGRISRAKAFLGSALKIVPVLRVDSGKIDEHARVRTFGRALDAMVDAAALEANKADGAYVCVMHARAAIDAERVAGKLQEKLTTRPRLFETLEAGPVIGTHAGQGAVGLFVIPGSL